MIDWGTIGVLFGIVGTIAAIVFGILTKKKEQKQEDRSDGHSLGVIQSDLGYIKGGVDDLKTEVRELRGGQSDLSERVTRAEESAKQAHKRIDELKMKKE